MTTPSRRHALRLGMFAALAIALPPTMAASASNTWPDKAVRIVVPYSPGGSADILSRELAQHLSVATGQSFIVDNRPGAGGWAGAQSVMRAEPDGYTLLLATNGSHGLSQLFIPNSPFDPFTDFTHITPAVMMPMAIVVNPSVPATNATELVEWAKKQPGEVSFGVAGIGSPHHLAGENLNGYADGHFSAVAYKGTGQSIIDVIGGHIPMVVSSLAAALPHHKQERLRIIGMVEAERAAAAPDIPTVGESLPDYVMPDTWMGYMGPPNMDPALTARINELFVTTLQKPEVQKSIDELGLQVLTSSPEEFSQRMKDDVEFFKKMIEDRNIQTDR